MTSLRTLLNEAASRAAEGKIDEALTAYASVLARAPQLPEVHYNVAALRLAQGDLPGAEASLRVATRLKPNWAQAYLGLGHLYLRQEKLEDAERAFDRAAQLEPTSVEALINQAKALDRLRAWGEALPVLRRARALAPENPQMWLALRRHLLRFQRHEEAFEDFRAFEANAKLSAPLVIAGLISARIAPGADVRRQVSAPCHRLAIRARRGGYAGAAVAQAEYFDVSRAALRRLHETYDRLRQEERAGMADLVARSERTTGPAADRLFVGRLSNHVMGRFMLGVLRRHDRARFSGDAVFDRAARVGGRVTGEFRACCDRFLRLDDVDNLEAAQRIAADRLDLLVDLMGRSGSSRPGILLYKPAPVIITHLGSHGPIGLGQVDFKLSDRHVDLPDAGEYQIEAPLAMTAVCCQYAAWLRRRTADLAPELGFGPQGDRVRRIREFAQALAALPGAMAHNPGPGTARRAGVLAVPGGRAAALRATTARFRHSKRRGSLYPARRWMTRPIGPATGCSTSS